MIHHINERKDKNHMIVSINAEKARQNSTSIHNKNSYQSGYSGNMCVCVWVCVCRGGGWRRSVSINAKKAFDKIQHPLMIKTLTKVGIEGVCVCVCVRAQSCPTVCNHMDCSPPGSPGHGIFQARTLEWV